MWNENVFNSLCIALCDIFVTCQNYILASMLLSLFVCMFVCLFVCLWRCPTISQEQIVRSSPNLVHIWNLELRRDLLFLVLMTSLMTSSGPKVGQILKLPYLSQFLSYSVETKTEMQRWLWDIILLWLTSGVTSGASGSTLNFDIKMAAIFKIHVAY